MVLPPCLVCPHAHPVPPGAKFCTTCGSSLVEATATEGPGHCSGCGAGLVPTAVLCPRCGTPPSVFWRTEDWTNAMRGEFTAQLLDAGVPHRWEGLLLLVDQRYEPAVDRLLDERFGPDGD